MKMKCNVCGKVVKRKSNNQKYCSPCSIKVRTDKCVDYRHRYDYRKFLEDTHNIKFEKK